MRITRLKEGVLLGDLSLFTELLKFGRCYVADFFVLNERGFEDGDVFIEQAQGDGGSHGLMPLGDVLVLVAEGIVDGLLFVDAGGTDFGRASHDDLLAGEDRQDGVALNGFGNPGDGFYLRLSQAVTGKKASEVKGVAVAAAFAGGAGRGPHFKDKNWTLSNFGQTSEGLLDALGDGFFDRVRNGQWNDEILGSLGRIGRGGIARGGSDAWGGAASYEKNEDRQKQTGPGGDELPVVSSVMDVRLGIAHKNPCLHQRIRDSVRFLAVPPHCFIWPSSRIIGPSATEKNGRL